MGRARNSGAGGALIRLMGSRAFVLVVVVAVMSVCASPAWGAFPGRDGDLAVATSGGLELVVPGTGAARSICTSVVLCGHPAQPSFSPNGRAIAFVDAASDRPVVVAADGSCLWCLLGAPLTTVTGSEPAFTHSGRGVTVAGDGLWRVSLTGGGARRLVEGPVDGAVWSSRGVGCAGARRLDLGRATWPRKASAAGARALAVVLAGRREARARSRRLCVDRAGCRWQRAAAGSGRVARMVAVRSADRLPRCGRRGRDRRAPRRTARSRRVGPRDGARLAAGGELRTACVQATEGVDRARIEP